MPPSNSVLTQFGIQLVASLGGRINQHWLVEAHGERFVLRCWGRSPLVDDPASHIDSISYEVRLLASLAALGWPVAPAVAEPASIDGHTWSLAPFLAGDLPVPADAIHESREEQRARGRLLADSTLDEILTRNELERPEEVSILRWHLEQARRQVAELRLQGWPGTIVHGDFTPWNLRFTDGTLSGILDFELAH